MPSWVFVMPSSFIIGPAAVDRFTRSTYSRNDIVLSSNSTLSGGPRLKPNIGHSPDGRRALKARS